MSKLNKVLYDVDQSADTSAAERILARKNVGLELDTEWTRGAAGGLATLDSSGMVPAEQLPSYVDDVIEGYYHDGKFYSDSAHAHEITGELNKIYIDITDGANNASYRYTESGSYIQISAQNTFSTISVDTGDETYDDVTADAVSDTVTLDRGTGIALDVDGKHITVGHTNSVAAGTAGSKTASFGNETLDVPWVDFDSEGHITGNGTHTHTINTATNANKGVVTLTDTIGSQDAATGGLGLSPKAVHSLGGAIYAAQYLQNTTDNDVAVKLFDIKLVDNNTITVIRGLVNYIYDAKVSDCYGVGEFEMTVSYNPNGATKFEVLNGKIYWTTPGQVHKYSPNFMLGYTFDQATLKLSVYAVHIRRNYFCGVTVTQATCENGDMRKAMTFVYPPHTESIPAGIGYLDNVDGLPNKVTSWSNTLSDANVPSEKLVKDTIDNLGGTASSSSSNNVRVTVNTSGGEVSSVSVTDNSVNATDVSDAISDALSGLPPKVTAWSDPVSDDNIPSEKLVKNTIDSAISGLPPKVTAWSVPVSDSNVPSEKLVKNTIDNLGGTASSSSSNNVQVTVNTSGGEVSSVSVTDNSANTTDISNAINALGGSASSSSSNNVQVTVNTSGGEVDSVSVIDNSVNSTDVSNAIATAVSGLPTKVTTWSSPASDANVPSEKLVKDTIDDKQDQQHAYYANANTYIQLFKTSKYTTGSPDGITVELIGRASNTAVRCIINVRVEVTADYVKFHEDSGSTGLSFSLYYATDPNASDKWLVYANVAKYCRLRINATDSSAGNTELDLSVFGTTMTGRISGDSAVTMRNMRDASWINSGTIDASRMSLSGMNVVSSLAYDGTHLAYATYADSDVHAVFAATQLLNDAGGVSECELDGSATTQVAPNGWVDSITGFSIVNGGTASVPRKKIKLTRAIQYLTDQRPTYEYLDAPVCCDHSGSGGVVPAQEYTNIPANDSTYTQTYYTAIGHRSYKAESGTITGYVIDDYGVGRGPGTWLATNKRLPLICRVNFNYHIIAPSNGATWVDFDVSAAVSTFSGVRFKDNDSNISIRARKRISAMCFSVARYWQGDMELVFPLQPDDYNTSIPNILYIGFRPLAATMPTILPDGAGNQYIGVKISKVTITYE